MNFRSDPKSQTWSSGAVGKIITTTFNMLDCRAGGNFHALIHEELLCYFSPYYAAAFKGGFSESNQGYTSFELTELQAKLFVMWLYSGRIEDDINYSDVLDLYIFADMTDTTALRKAIMDHLFKLGQGWSSFDNNDVPEHFKTLPPSSGLVRWMVDKYADYWATCPKSWDWESETSVYKLASEVPGEFFDQVRAAFWRDWCKIGESCAKTRCHYHEHETVEEWKNCAGGLYTVVDRAYLRGTMAAGTLVKPRYATYGHHYDSEGNRYTGWRTTNKLPFLCGLDCSGWTTDV